MYAYFSAMPTQIKAENTLQDDKKKQFKNNIYQGMQIICCINKHNNLTINRHN